MKPSLGLIRLQCFQQHLIPIIDSSWLSYDGTTERHDNCLTNYFCNIKLIFLGIFEAGKGLNVM